jgi:hypothetical protein
MQALRHCHPYACNSGCHKLAAGSRLHKCYDHELPRQRWQPPSLLSGLSSPYARNKARTGNLYTPQHVAHASSSASKALQPTVEEVSHPVAYSIWLLCRHMDAACADVRSRCNLRLLRCRMTHMHPRASDLFSHAACMIHVSHPQASMLSTHCINLTARSGKAWWPSLQDQRCSVTCSAPPSPC